MIKQTAPIHLQQGMLCHLQTIFFSLPLEIGQQKRQIVRRWKFRRITKAAVFSVIQAAIKIRCHMRQLHFCRTGHRGIFLQICHDPFCLIQQEAAVFRPLFHNSQQ